jgi:tetratricopeptide (TPR) repeat protein
VLVSIGGWQFLMPEKPDSASIFASYYKPFPGTLIASTTRSNTSVTRNDSLLRQGAYYYDQGGFEQAIQTFALIPDSFEQYNKVQFLRGLAYLADGEEALARSSLAPVMADSTSNLYEPASWYTALVCIKQEDKLCAVSHLEGLVKAESPDFAKEAKKILAELDL